MITEEQIEKLRAATEGRVFAFATLTRDYKPEFLDYTLFKGTIVMLEFYLDILPDLYVGDKCVDGSFPLDAAELLE